MFKKLIDERGGFSKAVFGIFLIDVNPPLQPGLFRSQLKIAGGGWGDGVRGEVGRGLFSN